jgi:hypothetical protein
MDTSNHEKILRIIILKAKSAQFTEFKRGSLNSTQTMKQYT